MNRKQKRVKHKLIEFHGVLNRTYRMILIGGQKKYTCTCNSGWMSFALTPPIESFENHVKVFNQI